MDLPIFYINIDSDDELGIEKMSFVEAPAVEINWQAFDEQKAQKLLFADEEKHIVTSVALRANFPIYRRDAKFGEYYLIFSKEQISKIVERFFRKGLTGSVNVEHSKDVDGCYLIESYFAKEDNAFGVDAGSWICSYKVDNADVWKGVKDGTFKGFSIEGYFDYSNVACAKQTNEDEAFIEYINSFLY